MGARQRARHQALGQASTIPRWVELVAQRLHRRQNRCDLGKQRLGRHLPQKFKLKVLKPYGCRSHPSQMDGDPVHQSLGVKRHHLAVCAKNGSCKLAVEEMAKALSRPSLIIVASKPVVQKPIERVRPINRKRYQRSIYRVNVPN